MSNKETVESYVRQLNAQNGDALNKGLAAQALGNLASFLSERHRALVPKKAMDLGVWQALLQALSGGFDAVQVEDAVVVAIAQLLVPPADAGQSGHGSLVEGLGAASRNKRAESRSGAAAGASTIAHSRLASRVKGGAGEVVWCCGSGMRARKTNSHANSGLFLFL